jgi:hypothetical protein
VATTGSDAAAGDLAAPFATVERAQTFVRELKHKQGGTLLQPVTIYIHGGTYTLSKPLRFTPEDSGVENRRVTYAAFHNQKVTFSGGREITGWKEVTVDGKRLWAAEVPGVREGKWNFHQLWMNGRRATLARSPNDGFFRIAAMPGLDFTKPYQEGQARFQFKPGEIQQWKNPEDVEVVILSFWISQRRGIAGVDEAQHIVTLRQPSAMRLTDGFGRQPHLARYYVENAFELLDSPGEWYLNRKTGTIYYMPRPGEEIAKAEAIAPVLESLLLVEGDAQKDQRVQYLTFRGLRFEYSEWWLPQGGRTRQVEGQSASGVPGAIQLTGARFCSFEQCTIAHLSGYGIHFSRGCDRDRLAGSDLFDLGTGGVKIGSDDRLGNIRPPGMRSPFPGDAKLETHDIEVSDNDIREGGRVFHHGNGVWIGQSYNNLVSHNEIQDFYQLGVSVGWTWGYGKSLAHHNVIEYNRIHKIGQKWSSDLGGIYTLGTQPGTVLRYNVIYDVKCADYIGRGIYLDEGSSDMVVENNVLYDTSTGGFGTNYGRRNAIRNNVFAFGDVSQIEPVGNMNKPEALEGSSYVLERNIFYWKAGHELLPGSWQPKPADKLVMQHNLYWREGGGEIRFGSRTLAELQKTGREGGSVIADPLFVDPAHGDFNLKPESPALAVGFRRFDLTTVGPRGPMRRPATD